MLGFLEMNEAQNKEDPHSVPFFSLLYNTAQSFLSQVVEETSPATGSSGTPSALSASKSLLEFIFDLEGTHPPPGLSEPSPQDEYAKSMFDAEDLKELGLDLDSLGKQTGAELTESKHADLYHPPALAEDRIENEPLFTTPEMIHQV